MHAKIFHQTSWALTATGRPLEMYKKTHTSEKENVDANRAILFIGGVHGDEPEGVQLAEEFLLWLKEQDPSTVKNWILIPCLKPDGHSQNQRTNSRGVDLNRNFPSPDWQSDAKSPRYYPGPSAGSENETKALVRLIEDEKPRLIIHFHSWEPCVVYTGGPGKEAAEILGAGTGYEVREDIGYPTPGSLGQFGWYQKNIPVICIEAQEKCDLKTVWPKFGPGLKKLMTEFTANFPLRKEGSP